MDQLAVQCPVCTLFLHNGITLESHLDTHPKDQVIKALCNIASNSKSSNYGSRTSTPAHSERSFRSRSRTPATDDSAKWTASRSTEHDRYWRRTPSRTSKSTPLSSTSRNGTPDIRMLDVSFENHGLAGSAAGQHGNNPFLLKADKLQQTFQSPPVPDFDQQFVYYPDQQEDREIKFSRSAEYSAMDNSNNMFPYNVPTMAAPSMKLLPTAGRKANDLVKVLPKPNNILLKTSMGGMQYIGPGVKPMVMVPSAPTFVHKNVQNNMIMTGGVPNPQMQIDTKTVPPPLGSNPLNQMSCTGAFTPGTTVVTQNSQIIYREMVHNIDGKPFITTMPTLLGNENVTNLSQATSMYQNVMVVDQFGNTSCMYTAPQQMMNKACPTSMYNETGTMLPNVTMDKSVQNMNDPKTLIIEVGPLVASATDNVCEDPSSSMSQPVANSPADSTDRSSDNVDPKLEMSGSTKGLKILSNIKVEVPVQHHKNMVNTVMDLTGTNESDYPVERVESPEKILPDLEDNNQMSSDDTQPSMSSGDSMASHTFSVIKNVGNPSKSSIDNKLDTDFSDSCPVPDLICNEKPSISPCSELSENGDNSTDRTSISPKPVTNQVSHSNLALPEKKTQLPQKPFRHNTLRLNNIFVRKHKKVLQIKNAKNFSVSLHKKSEQRDSIASSSSSRTPEKFTMNKLHQTDKTDCKEKSNLLQTISVEEIKEGDENNEFDADTEEQSMDIEQVEAGSLNQSEFGTNMDLIQVKEEINTSNEGGFSNETLTPSDRMLNSIDSLRPINVINYGNMSNEDFNEEANDRELLNLEGTSKNKQFVNMMNENYFGDNIYADYFTPDRVEAFDAEREAATFKDGGKDGMYLWGEPSQKDDEFVLPNFIHESYKIAESNGIDYSELGARDVQAHAAPASYSRLVTARTIMKEEKPDDTNNLLTPIDSKESLSTSILQVYENIQVEEAKPKIEVDRLIKQEVKRKRKDYVCPTCKVDQVTETAFHEHLKIHPLECLTCGKCFFRRANLALHIKTHLGIKNYKCEVCEKRFLTRQKLMEHHNVHTGRAPIKCTLCDDTFRRYSNMVQHRDRHHLHKRGKVRDFVCPCGLVLHSRAKLRWHQETHAERPRACHYCSDKFVHAASLTRHIRRAHNQYFLAERLQGKHENVQCPVCKQVYLRSNLRTHLQTHSGQRPFVCIICNKSFTTKWNLKLHRWTHMSRSAKPFKCTLCKGAFIRQSEYISHMNAHKSVRPYTCNYCGCQFIRKYNCQRHVREHETAKKYVCKVAECGKSFHRSYYLAEHMKVHSGARPFACAVCGKTSSNKSNHNKHVKIHHAREPVATEA